MKRADYIDIINQAFDIFNQQMETEYSLTNIGLLLTDAKTADKDIPEFIRNYPEAAEPDMFEPGYYKSIRGEAFISAGKAGIVLRTDTGEDTNQFRHLVLHEISHIYCMTHELNDGENFYKKYVVDDHGNTFENGIIAGGYAVWREFVAEFMARLLDVFQEDFSIALTADNVEYLLDEIENIVPDTRECITAILIDTFSTKDLLDKVDKKASLSVVEWFERLQTPSWKELFSIVYDQIFNDDKYYWEIDFDFIHELGSRYLSIRTEAMLNSMGGIANKQQMEAFLREKGFGGV